MNVLLTLLTLPLHLLSSLSSAMLVIATTLAVAALSALAWLVQASATVVFRLVLFALAAPFRWPDLFLALLALAAVLAAAPPVRRGTAWYLAYWQAEARLRLDSWRFALADRRTAAATTTTTTVAAPPPPAPLPPLYHHQRVEVSLDLALNDIFPPRAPTHPPSPPPPSAYALDLLAWRTKSGPYAAWAATYRPAAQRYPFAPAPVPAPPPARPDDYAALNPFARCWGAASSQLVGSQVGGLQAARNKLPHPHPLSFFPPGSELGRLVMGDQAWTGGAPPAVVPAPAGPAVVAPAGSGPPVFFGAAPAAVPVAPAPSCVQPAGTPSSGGGMLRRLSVGGLLANKGGRAGRRPSAAVGVSSGLRNEWEDEEGRETAGPAKKNRG